MARKVRWGHLREIAHVRRIPSAAYSGLPRRLKHLTTWRRMHMLAGHPVIRGYGRSKGHKPSSNLSIRQKRRFIQLREKRS